MSSESHAFCRFGTFEARLPRAGIAYSCEGFPFFRGARARFEHRIAHLSDYHRSCDLTALDLSDKWSRVNKLFPDEGSGRVTAGMP